MRLREQLEEIAATLEEKREGLLASLPALDTRLVSGDTTSLHELQTLQARLAYLGKWQTQVWEALLSLI
jgi:hypothetical protein